MKNIYSQTAYNVLTRSWSLAGIFLCLLLLPWMARAQAPSISSFTPTNGPVGTSVSFSGSGFNATAAQNVVFFGATQATVTAASATSLTVTVPLGTTYAYPTVTNLTTALTDYASQPFVVTLNGAVAFAPKTDFTTGSIPLLVSIGDLDGDGKSDLAVANNKSGTVSVLRNTSAAGAVSFAPKVDFSTGSGPSSVSIGDLDGDGKLDLAVANDNSSTVTVLRNTSVAGTISFTTIVNLSTGTGGRSVTIGDVDGDDKPDLAVANYNVGTVSVFRNTSAAGAVSFAAKVDFTAGSNPQAVTIGDLDSDGKPDLAVANYGAGTVSVLLNTSAAGTVSFAAKVDLSTGTATAPYLVSIGDLDGDGKPDLAVANNKAIAVSVFRNTTSAVGAVSFATRADFTTGGSTTPFSVSIGDVDGDGKPDLAAANYNVGTVSVFRNTSAAGAVSFADKVDFATGANPQSVSIGDLDGDGKPDLAVANNSANTVSVLRQASAPQSLTAPQPLPVELTAFTATATGPSAVRLAWTTASEKNSQSFAAERSLDGAVFERVGTVPAAGSSAAVRSYTLLDALLPAGATRLYYRLKQLDLDGTVSYSPVRVVAKLASNILLTASPNPTAGELALNLSLPVASLVRGTLTTPLGQSVLHLEQLVEAGSQVLPLDLSAQPAGMYLLRLETPHGSQTLRITKY